jgi:hypothetical protein
MPNSHEGNPVPEWYVLGNPLIWSVARTAYNFFQQSASLCPSHLNAAHCAAIHYINCLNTSIDANKKGNHSIAISMIRPCVEALTIVELGLLRETTVGSELIDVIGNKVFRRFPAVFQRFFERKTLFPITSNGCVA